MISDFLSTNSLEGNPASFIHLYYWRNAGNKVTVITYQSKGRVSQLYNKHLDHLTENSNCKIIRIGGGTHSWTWKIPAILWRGYFAMRALTLGLRISKCDLIIGTAPPIFIGWVGFLIAKLRSIPFISEVHPTTQSRVGIFGKLSNIITQFLKDFLLHHSDHLVLSDEENLYDPTKFPNKPWTSIPVGLNLLKYRETVYTAYNQIIIEKGVFKIAYVGEFNRDNSLNTILLASKNLQDLHDIQYYLVGYGIQKELMELRIKNEKITNISVYGDQSKIDILQIIEQMDILLFMGRKNESIHSAIPCGLLESLAMGKPVIVGARGRAQEIVAVSNAGIVIDPDSATDLQNAVLKLYHNSSLRKEMGGNGRRYIINNYPSEDLDMSFAHLMKESS